MSSRLLEVYLLERPFALVSRCWKFDPGLTTVLYRCMIGHDGGYDTGRCLRDDVQPQRYSSFYHEIYMYQQLPHPLLVYSI